MARMMSFVFIVMLPLACCLHVNDFCAKQSSPDTFFCHPDRPDAYIKCDPKCAIMSERGGSLEKCDPNQAFCTKVKACLSIFLSDCAEKAMLPTDAGASQAQSDCLSHHDKESNHVDLLPDENPESFIICPLNAAMARQYTCAPGLSYDDTEKACVEKTTDGDHPPAANMIVGSTTATYTQSNGATQEPATQAPAVLNATSNTETNTTSADPTTEDSTADDDIAKADMIVASTSPEVNSTDNSTSSEDSPAANIMQEDGNPTSDPDETPGFVMPPVPSTTNDEDNSTTTATIQEEEGEMEEINCPPAPAVPSGPCKPAPAPVAPRPVAPWPVAPRPVAPRPVAPRPVAPRPVAPRPVAPRPVASSPAVCRPRYLYHPEKADWEGARLLCEREGGQLAIITSERAQGTIQNRFTYQKEFWIGATDLEREGQFRWVNGEPMGFARWGTRQPKSSYPNNEHCVSFNYGKGKWADRNCYESLPFLCQTMVCQPRSSRYPSGYPRSFQGPLNYPYHFPRNQNFPGPRSWQGIATQNLPYGRGFPYNVHPQFRPVFGRK